jgi:hypothetical protein
MYQPVLSEEFGVMCCACLVCLCGQVMNMVRKLAARERSTERPSCYTTADFAADEPDAESESGRGGVITDVLLCNVRLVRQQKLFCRGEAVHDEGSTPRQMGAFMTLQHSRQGKARQALDPDSLRMLSMAEERLADSATAYNLPTPSHTVDRPEETNGRFRSVQPLEKDVASRRRSAWARRFSTVLRDIETLKDGAEACLTSTAAGRILTGRGIGRK